MCVCHKQLTKSQAGGDIAGSNEHMLKKMRNHSSRSGEVLSGTLIFLLVVVI